MEIGKCLYSKKFQMGESRIDEEAPQRSQEAEGSPLKPPGASGGVLD